MASMSDQPVSLTPTDYAGLEFVPQPVAQIEPGRLIWAIEGVQMTATQPPNNPIQVTSTCDGMAI